METTVLKPNARIELIDGQSARHFIIKRSSVYPYWTIQPEFPELEDVCKECGGEGYVDYILGVDDSRKMACEKCNAGGDEPDPDRAYDEHRDAEADLELAKQEARD